VCAHPPPCHVGRSPDLGLDAQDSDGDTALHLAAHGVNVIRGRQHVQVHAVVFFLSASSYVADWACSDEVVEQLVHRGASIYVERKNGRKESSLFALSASWGSLSPLPRPPRPSS
jgi:ankyrin repeat protein